MIKKWIPVVVVIVLALLAIGVIRWYYSGKAVDAQLELNNARAEAATLETLHDNVVGKLGLTIEGLEATNDTLRGVVDGLGERLTLQGEVTLSYRNQIVALTTARVEGDSTRIPIEFKDDVAEVEAIASFPGHIEPNPTPEVTTLGEIRIPQLDLTIAVTEDPETCAPRFLVQTRSSLIETTRVDGRVAFESTCLHDRRRKLFEINADLGIGAILGGIGGFLAGLAAGS